MNPLTERALRERPQSTALLFGERRWSWSALDRDAARMARGLHARGVRPGDRVGVLSANAPEVVLLVHAAARMGVTLALLNTRLTEADWREQLSRARCVLVATGPEVQADLGVPGIALRELGHASGEADPDLDVAADPARALALLYTSGTTGKPKGALLSLGALMAQAHHTAAHLGASPDDVHLCNLPLFHIGGLAMVFRAAQQGAALVLHERFDAHATLRDLATRDATHLSLVATTLSRLLEALGDAPLAAPRLRVVLVGGGPLPAPLRLRAERSGLQPLGTYGLTEACSQVTTVPPSQREDAGQSSGRALPGMEVRIVDARRIALPAGRTGEIEVRGPSLMLGYDGDPQATAEALADGWLRTRDLGTLDAAGWLTVHARRSDLILSGGENIYPAEVEAALLGITGVRDAAVVGRDDPAWGQVPVALLVLDPDVTVEAVGEALALRLARYKLPRSYQTCAELPRNAAGKLDRVRLRALLRG